MLSVIHITVGYTWSTETLAVASLRLNCRQSISRFGKLSLWENSVGNMVGFVCTNLDCVHKVIFDWQKPRSLLWGKHKADASPRFCELNSIFSFLCCTFPFPCSLKIQHHLTVFTSHDQFLCWHFSSFAPLVGPLYFPHCDWLAEEKAVDLFPCASCG